jgi:hypothetical protein
MSSANEKLTALANEVRELSGTTTTKGIDTMISDIDAANAEIAGQVELISQITAALEGKAGGTASEDLNAELTEYASLNTEFEEVINSLPSAGSSGTNVETCNLTFNSADDVATSISLLLYTTVDSEGNVIQGDIRNTDITGSTLTVKCMCNTSISFIITNRKITETNARSIIVCSLGDIKFGYFTITAQPGETAVFTLS